MGEFFVKKYKVINLVSTSLWYAPGMFENYMTAIRTQDKYFRRIFEGAYPDIDPGDFLEIISDERYKYVDDNVKLYIEEE